MAYRLKKGVVLFRMCGEDYLFPSREASVPIAVLVSSTPRISSLLTGQMKENDDQLNTEEKEKLKRLICLGFVEECE